MSFRVNGLPAPQGSKRGFAHGGRVVMVESSAKVKPWREAVRGEAQRVCEEHDGFTRDVPLVVVLTFVLPLPKSAPKRRRIWPTKRPDVDKLARSTCDALTDSGLIGDDAQIVDLRARKVYAQPGEAGGCHLWIAPDGDWVLLQPGALAEVAS